MSQKCRVALVVVVSVVILLAFFDLGRGEGQYLLFPEIANLVRDLKSSDSERQARARYGLLLNHRELVDSLVEIIDVDRTDGFGLADPAVNAAEVLSEMGSSKALPVFVSRVENGPTAIAHELLPLGAYPYSLALIPYGENAVAEIVRHLNRLRPEDVSPHAIDLYAHVIKEVYGHGKQGKADALNRMEREVRRAQFPDNFLRLLGRLERLYNPRPKAKGVASSAQIR